MCLCLHSPQILLGASDTGHVDERQKHAAPKTRRLMPINEHKQVHTQQLARNRV